MFDIILEIVLGVILIYLVLLLMVRHEKKDEVPIPVIDPKPIIDVIYFESMTLEDKYKHMTVKLDEIGKFIPPEQELIHFQTSLADVVKLKRKVDDIYRFEMDQFENVIAWLEKPSVTRGRYKPLNRTDDDLDVKELMRAIHLTVKQAFGVLFGATDIGDVDEESAVEPTGRNVVNMFKVPEVGLDNLLEIRRAFDRILPVAKFWTQKTLDDMSESTKIWYVVYMVVRHTLLNREKLMALRDTVSEMMSHVIIFRAQVNKDDDLTTVGLELFPDQTVKKKGFFTRLLEFSKRSVNAVRPK